MFVVHFCFVVFGSPFSLFCPLSLQGGFSVSVHCDQTKLGIVIPRKVVIQIEVMIKLKL